MEGLQGASKMCWVESKFQKRKTYLFGQKAIRVEVRAPLYFYIFFHKNKTMFMFIIALYLITCLRMSNCQSE
jgi:hypothetical protein